MTWTTLPRSEGASGLSCHMTGEGPLVVLIHGVGLRSEAWGALIPHLVTHYRVVAVDMPGHGSSTALSGDAPMLRDFTTRIAEFLMPFGRPAALVGHSMGAMIALDLAIRFPPLVASVTAMNAVFQRDEAARAAVETRAAALDGAAVADLAAPLARWFGPNPKSALAEAQVACGGWLEACDPSGYATAYRVFAAHDGPEPDDLVRLPCPALFVTGTAEPNSTPAMSQTMADLAPLGCAHIVEGAAHMAPMTHPDQIADVLLPFLGQRAAA